MARKPKILTKEQILAAMARTKSNKAAARYLHVSYPHYRKYAKTFTDSETGKTLFDLHLNQSGRGIPKIFDYKTNEPKVCLLYTSPSPRDRTRSRMPSSA